MSALDRLRALEISRKGGNAEPTKPTKPSFDGFDGPSTSAFANIFEAANDKSAADLGVMRRHAKALAILKEQPSRRLAIVAEAPKPGEPFGHVCTAIRGVVIGEVAIPAASYDAYELLAPMQHYGSA